MMLSRVSRCDNLAVLADGAPPRDQHADELDRDDLTDKATPAPRKMRRLGAFGHFTIVQIWIAMIAGVVASGLTVLVGHLAAHPSQADQLQAFEQQQGALGYTPVRQLIGDLRDDGTQSYVFVMRSNANALLNGARGTSSDRVIILDDDDGTLHVAFSFQPAGSVLSSSEIKRDVEGLPPSQARRAARALAQPNPYLARIDGLMDVDGAGRLEVVGSWNDYAMQAVNPRPFVIAWDPGRLRYVMSPLVTDRLEASRLITKVRNPGLVGRIVRSRYVRPQTLHDIRTGAAFRSLIVDDYAAVIHNGHLVLVAAYVVRGIDFEDERLWEIVPYRLYGTATDPAVFDCAMRDLFMGPPGPPSFSVAGAALAAWRASAATAGC